MSEEAKNSAELISDCGKAALFTFAGKELKREAALDILQKNRIGEGSFETQVFRYRDCPKTCKKIKVNRVVNQKISGKFSSKSNCGAASIGYLPPMYPFNN